MECHIWGWLGPEISEWHPCCVCRGDRWCGWKCHPFNWAAIWRQKCRTDLFSAFVTEFPWSLLWEVGCIYFDGILLWWWWNISSWHRVHQCFYFVVMACPSGVDATTMLMKILAAAGLLETLANQDRQSADYFQAPNIHSKVMLYMVSSSDHQFTLLFMFLPLRNLCKGLWSLCMMISNHWYNSSILVWHNRHHRLLVWECSIFAECPWMCVKEKWLVILDFCVPLIAVHHKHHLRHLCRVWIFSKDVDSEVWVLVSKLLSSWQMLLGCLVSSQILLHDT